MTKVFARRSYWGNALTSSKSTNFYWRARLDMKLDMFMGDSSKKMINKFERFMEMHHKDSLFRNLWHHCTVGYSANIEGKA